MNKNRYDSKTPRLLISAGTGWSATTPLLYTLAIANRYCHPSYWKESEYLLSIDGPAHQKYLDKYKEENSTAEEERIRNEGAAISWNKHPDISVHSKYITLSKQDKINWMTPPFTIQKYCHFYRNHWLGLQENSKYQAVADFSNANFALPEEKVKKFKPFLNEWFDTKVIMIFRDPVRRIFSEFQSRYYRRHFGRVYPNAMTYLSNYLDRSIPEDCEYIKHYKKWKKYFPTHPIVMEEFWDGETENLSNFLDFNIKDIYPNCYWPECGNAAPKYDGLSDQYLSDRENMTPQFYKKIKDKLLPEYEAWYDEFGSLPKTWGKHIYL